MKKLDKYLLIKKEKRKLWICLSDKRERDIIWKIIRVLQLKMAAWMK